MRLPLLVAVCLAFAPVSADVYNDVRIAEERFAKSNESAKQKLVAHYVEEIAEATAKGNFEKATGLTSRLELFRTNGLVMERDLGDVYVKYYRQLTNAKVQLLKAYQPAIQHLVKQGDLDEAKAIQDRIRDRGLTAKWVSIRSMTDQEKYVHHGNYQGRMQPGTDYLISKLNSTFEMRMGLINDSTYYGRDLPPIVSFRSLNVPKMYLAHTNNELMLMEFTDNNNFRESASFRIRPGLFHKSGKSFEAVNAPAHFLIMDGKRVVLKKSNSTDEFAKAATFEIGPPRFEF